MNQQTYKLFTFVTWEIDFYKLSTERVTTSSLPAFRQRHSEYLMQDGTGRLTSFWTVLRFNKTDDLVITDLICLKGLLLPLKSILCTQKQIRSEKDMPQMFSGDCRGKVTLVKERTFVLQNVIKSCFCQSVNQFNFTNP